MTSFSNSRCKLEFWKKKGKLWYIFLVSSKKSLEMWSELGSRRWEAVTAGGWWWLESIGMDWTQHFCLELRVAFNPFVPVWMGQSFPKFMDHSIWSDPKWSESSLTRWIGLTNFDWLKMVWSDWDDSVLTRVAMAHGETCRCVEPFGRRVVARERRTYHPGGVWRHVSEPLAANLPHINRSIPYKLDSRIVFPDWGYGKDVKEILSGWLLSGTQTTKKGRSLEGASRNIKDVWWRL